MKVYTSLLNGVVFNIGTKEVQINGRQEAHIISGIAVTEVADADWNSIKTMYKNHPYIKNKVIFEGASVEEAVAKEKDQEHKEHAFITEKELSDGSLSSNIKSNK